MGGIVTFTGTVRRHSRGVTVERLEYEAYGPMAVREMTRLCDEIEAEVAGVRLAVEHRVGRLEIGDIAVVIAAGVPAASVEHAIWAVPSHRYLKRVTLFDVYTGEQVGAGRKSLAYALVYQADDRTLTDTEVNAMHREIVERLRQDLGAEVRGPGTEEAAND
jgi:hypothetical protein